MAIDRTSLRNLFLYIRDLYDVAGVYFNFDEELGNPKREGKTGGRWKH